jgi:hypothetical protein
MMLRRQHGTIQAWSGVAHCFQNTGLQCEGAIELCYGLEFTATENAGDVTGKAALDRRIAGKGARARWRLCQPAHDTG